MGSLKDLKLLLAFVVVFSMLSLPGFLSAGSYLPQIHLARATMAPNQPWYPAGPSMDKLQYQIYTDSSSEQLALQSGAIDIPDTPISPSQSSLICSSPSFFCTAPVPFSGYFELEFHLGQNFWGCQMNYGNSACGVNIRQGIAHGLDKTVFVNTELSGSGVAIDNPVPPSVNLVSPNPCGWDSAHVQSGSSCIAAAPGGTAYHLATATAGSGCTSTPTFSYTPGCGTPDFCAAADHFIAAGLATGKNPTTCVLTGISASVTANPINFFIRNDDVFRLHMGESYEQFICALFTGSFTAGCGVPPSTTNIVFHTLGPITLFQGFTTSKTSVALTWWVYTAGFSDVQTFDASLYLYNSQFVSGIPSIQPPNGPCSSQSVPSSSASNYMYLCNPNYDSISNQMEFAPCMSAPGDPTPGAPNLTFSNCPSTTQLTATSASYQTQDLFGQNAFTIPIWSQTNQFAYLSNWQRVVLYNGNVFIPPGNTVAEFNAYSPNPAVPGTIRQGYSQAARSLNPFIATTNHDLGIIGNVWDSLLHVNPTQPSTTLNWMAVATPQLGLSGLTYTPPPGTVAAFRFTLRNDVFWQTGQKVTAWDLAFSYIALRATGASLGAGLAPVTGVKVLSASQFDIDVSGVGLFTKLYVGSAMVFPGRVWSSCGTSTWDAGANKQDFAAANAALTPCIGPNVSSSGVVLPSASDVDPSKIVPTYDPIAAGAFVGSGQWMCGSGSSIGGPSCSSSGTQTPPAGGSYNLQRYGLGTMPGASLNTFFRSNGNLALWTWSGNTGNFPSDFLGFSVASLCFGKTPVPTGCAMWSMGIGNPTGSSGSPSPIGLTQVSIIQRFVGVNWVAPYDWHTSPPQNIAPFAPVLYEGSVTLNPTTLVGCAVSYNNGGGYDC
jgi:ABC-type transport system substrate-binding protein